MKLSAALRDKLVSYLVGRAMEPSEKSLREREHAIGDKLYFTAFPQELQEKMNALPDGFFLMDDCLYILSKVENKSVYTVFHMSEKRPIPAGGYSYKGSTGNYYTKGDDNYDEIMKYRDDYKSYCSEKEKLQDEIFATISKYRTVEKLCKEWKEIASVLLYVGISIDLQQLPDTSTRMLKLNKKCFLPIKPCRTCDMLNPEGDNVCPLKGEVSEDFTCAHWVTRV